MFNSDSAFPRCKLSCEAKVRLRSHALLEAPSVLVPSRCQLMDEVEEPV